MASDSRRSRAEPDRSPAATASTEDRTPHEAWTSGVWDVLRPEGSGVYVNFLENEGPDRVRAAYPGSTYDRLAATKRRYDPDNVFRFNQNVLPAQ